MCTTTRRRAMQAALCLALAAPPALAADEIAIIVHKDNPAVIGPGMVFFAHMILMNSEAGAAFCLGRTYIIGEKKPEPVSKAPLGMIIR